MYWKALIETGRQEEIEQTWIEAKRPNYQQFFFDSFGVN